MNIMKMRLLYISKTIPNIVKLINVKMTPRTWFVRKVCILEWSLMRCNKSPINFVSKKDMGSFSNFIKKSLTKDILIRMDIWRSNHLRIKSVAVFPMTIISSPNRINQMKWISLCFIPISTTDWVKKGRISCKRQPNISPNKIWIKCFLYRVKYLNKNLKEWCELIFSNLRLKSKKFSFGFRNRANPDASVSASFSAQCWIKSVMGHLYKPLPGSAI